MSRHFKLLLFGCLFHLCREPADQVRTLPFHEEPEILNATYVFFFGADGLNTGTHAAADVVVQTHPGSVPVDLDGAGPDLEVPANQLEGSRSQISGEIRSKVSGSILFDSPGDQYSRVFLVQGQLDVGVSLVIAQQDVVLGLVALDEVVLQRQGFHFIINNDEIHIRNFCPQVVQFEVRSGFLKI